VDLEVLTRPVRPDDEPRFVRLWPRLSAETRYRRFHAPVHRLPMSSVRRLVVVDHDQREAVVAEIGGEVVGVARYDRLPHDPSTAELAVVVEDAWQGVGLGRQLLTELLRLAAGRGVRTLVATVQADNERMLGILRRLLPSARLESDAGVLTVTATVAGAEPVAGRAGRGPHRVIPTG
jgi:RimJ/RimL family protein N-acetyltransferase